jgi:hypothetical protein
MQATQSASSQTAEVSEDIRNLQPLERFLIALNAPETKRQYPKRLESFLDFLQLTGTLENKITSFCTLLKIKNQKIGSPMSF